MVLEKELINTLPQLDRIEFKQSYNSLISYFKISHLGNLILGAMGVLLLATGQILASYVGFFGMIIGYIIDRKHFNNYRAELINKYFKLEHKKSKK